jgi:hypothetical protein
MRGAWSTLVALGGFLMVSAMAASMVNEYVSSRSTFLVSARGELNMAMATIGGMRSLIDQLQTR